MRFFVSLYSSNMRKLYIIIVIIALTLFYVPSWRLQLMKFLFGTNPKTVIHQIKQTPPSILSFSTPNLKVNIYSFSTFIPQMDAFKLKDTNMQYLILETSIENISDSIINPSKFNASYFVKDSKGKYIHSYLEEMTGYKQENNLSANTDAAKYYDDSMSSKTIFAPKLFFFPIDKHNTPVKIIFDDPLTNESHEFSLQQNNNQK